MEKEKPTKLYCYVDETGQDTNGKLFIVVAIIVTAQRDRLNEYLIKIENMTGKGIRKWTKSKTNSRFIDQAFNRTWFNGKIFFRVYHHTKGYTNLIVETIADAINSYNSITRVGDNKTTVIIDGLEPHLGIRIGAQLRKHGIRTEKVQGARDESDPIVRFADATAGLIRESEEGSKTYRTLIKCIEQRKTLYRLR